VRKTPRSFVAALAVISMAGACIAIQEGEGMPKRLTDLDDGGVDAFVTIEAPSSTTDAKLELPTADPHAVIGVDPPHGRFAGGQRALVRGNGFSSKARVWFGSAEVGASDVVPVDPTRLQVVVPPGEPGAADVRVQIGDDASTARTLAAGYRYDPFYAQPASGPTSGGTVITLSGKGTGWTAATSVRVGAKPCESVAVSSPVQLRCSAPAHAAGSVAVEVATPGAATQQVDDAFVYADSENGFKGGLSGAPLAGSLRVLVFDNYTGLPVKSAIVIAGDSLGNSLQKYADASGVAVFADAALAGKRSVTIAKKCYEPTTFVDVPVDTVTAYLTPVLSPECGADGGDIPPVGGKPSSLGTIKGQLVWKGGTEFKRAPWTNVPAPKSADERQAAYLFAPRGDPAEPFQLPDPAQAVLSDSGGSIGYQFSVSVYPGNITLYALAGIEDRKGSTADFTAYAFGMVRGVSALPGAVTSDVYITMDKPLDQAVSVTIAPPSPGPKGPDRVVASVAVQLGFDGYAVFPGASRSLPIAASVPAAFVGLPGLDGVLDGARFVTSASAVTGPNRGAPMSIVGKFVTTDATLPVPIDGFVQVPVLTTPAPSAKFDGRHLAVSVAPGGAPVDITVFHLDSGAGLVTWTIAAPAGKTSVELPDIGSLGAGLTPGPVDIGVWCARIEAFDYGALLYRHLASRGWNAYSYDVFHGYY
jgi:hypothetical protein